MITRLYIKNYAIISELNIEFCRGFNVFTGETGAGKSIIVGALGLILGEKGDTSSIRSGEERAIIEAEFDFDNEIIINFFKELGIDEVKPLIIRRELSSNGKNRIFINGLQEPLSKLETIGEFLADMHGQHDHQRLLNQNNHLEILDSFADCKNLTIEFSSIYNEYLEINKQINDLKKKIEEDEKEKIYRETVISDIKNLNLQDEDEENFLEEEIKKLENSEVIKNSLESSHKLLYSDANSAIEIIPKAINMIKSISEYDKKYKEICDILEDAQIKIDESASLISNYIKEINHNPEELEKMISRLDNIKTIKRKYKKNSIKELIEYYKLSCDSLKNSEDNEFTLNNLQKRLIELKEKLIEKARALSKYRIEKANILTEKINSELEYLGMQGAKVYIDIKYIKDEESPFIINSIPIKITDKGMDRVEFFISSNKGEELRPLKKIASGGEISRIMLALKSILAQSDVVDTLIFDEIDSGIGGITANNVSERIKSLSKNKQLLVITHLPQIASKADYHFKIIKSIEGDRTITKAIKIEGNERIEEIARMLGSISETSLKHAEEMIKNG